VVYTPAKAKTSAVDPQLNVDIFSQLRTAAAAAAPLPVGKGAGTIPSMAVDRSGDMV